MCCKINSRFYILGVLSHLLWTITLSILLRHFSFLYDTATLELPRRMSGLTREVIWCMIYWKKCSEIFWNNCRYYFSILYFLLVNRGASVIFYSANGLMLLLIYFSSGLICYYIQ